MRTSILLLALVTSACSSDPAAPVDSGLPPGDIATEAAARIDSGTPVDAADDRNALPDFGPRDTGADVVTVGDVPAADVVDATVADANSDVSGDVATDDGIIHPDRTAPQDDAGRLLCGAAPAGQACATNADCARCAPHPSGYPWCCVAVPGDPLTCTLSSVPCVGP